MHKLFEHKHLGPMIREFLRLEGQVAEQTKTIAQLEVERANLKFRLRRFIDVRVMPEHEHPTMLHCDIRIDRNLAREMQFEELCGHAILDAVHVIKENAR